MVKEACEENNKMFRENFYLKKIFFVFLIYVLLIICKFSKI